MVTESLDQHPAASRRPSRAGTPQCGTPAERTLAPGCPGTPGTPGGPSPGGADLRGKALPHARGLSKLVRALQPCRQLPLAELAAWFGDGLGPPPGRFDELPPSDGFGGGYLPLRGEEVSAGFKTPPRSGSPCASPAVTFRSASFMSTGGRSASFLSTGGRSESFSSTGSRRRSSFSLFGRPSLDASRLQLPEPSGSSPPGRGRAAAPPAEPGRGARALLASGGEAGESCGWRRQDPTAPSAAWASGPLAQAAERTPHPRPASLRDAPLPRLSETPAANPRRSLP
ncbi:unnamed protein product, partial [Prorocentrum cordatum]